MIARAQRTRATAPFSWWRLPLVAVLLAGVFAMHALAPGGGAPHVPAGSAHGATTMAAAPAEEDHRAGSGHGGGHVRHADQLCASGALAGGPSLPAPVPGPVVVPVPDVAARPCHPVAPDGGRAPPSLAELQLLRI